MHSFSFTVIDLLVISYISQTLLDILHLSKLIHIQLNRTNDGGWDCDTAKDILILFWISGSMFQGIYVYVHHVSVDKIVCTSTGTCSVAYMGLELPNSAKAIVGLPADTSIVNIARVVSGDKEYLLSRFICTLRKQEIKKKILYQQQ